MKTTKHTKGKWEYDMIVQPIYEDDEETILIKAGKYQIHNSERWFGEFVISKHTPLEEAEANVKMIVQSKSMHLFITTYIEAMEAKSRKSMWEIAMLQEAKEIIKATE